MRFLTTITLILLCATATAHHYQSGSLLIDHPWARATVPGTDVGVVYLKLVNQGAQPETLSSASNPDLAQSISLHQHSDDHGVMRMREVAKIVIPAHGTVTLAPLGYHIMLEGLKHPLAAGTRVPLTLHFVHAGDLPVEIAVEAVDAHANDMPM